MGRLSNEAIEEEVLRRESGVRRRIALASALLFLVFALVAWLERPRPRLTLRAIAPEEVAPGRPIPLVARVFEHRGVSLVEEITRGGEVAVELRRGGAACFEGALARGRAPHFAGVARAPKELGEYELFFRFGPLEARRTVRVSDAPRQAQLELLPPELRAEIRRGPLGGGPRFELHVGSGACVPEFPCELFVLHEGDVDSVELGAVDGVVVEPEAAREPGIAAWTARVRGLAATVAVTITRGDDAFVTEFALPVASGGTAAAMRRRLLSPGEPAVIEIASLSGGPFVYTHHHDLQLRAIGVAEGRLALEDLGVGVHRVEIGGDLFAERGFDRAGTLIFVVGRDPDEQRALVARVVRSVYDVVFEGIGGEGLEARPTELAARAWLARVEGYRAKLPPVITVSELEAAEHPVGGRVRLYGALAIVLLGAWISIRTTRSLARERQAALARMDPSEQGAWKDRITDGVVWVGLLLFLGYLLAAVALISRVYLFG